MRIGFDARCLNRPHLRGMGKVLLQVLDQGLRQTDWTFVLFGDEPRAPMQAPASSRVISDVREFKGHRFRSWEQVALPWLARHTRCDLLHCPGMWCPYWQPVPTVVTVHDTLPWHEEKSTPYLRYIAPQSYKRARRVITPSESSRRDIVAMWPDLAASVSVIRWGIDEAYLQKALPPLAGALTAQGVRPPYLLYFGGEVPRKRLDWTLRVWEALAASSPVRLVLCGLQSPGDTRWMSHLAPALRERVIPLGFIEEKDMPSLYSSADAVLYPTLYEGFGFPALESQATGTPVLMSAVGSLVELAGPGAIVLPVDDLDAWIAAARAGAECKRATAEAAREWARQFSWAAVWRATEKVFEAAAASG